MSFRVNFICDIANMGRFGAYVDNRGRLKHPAYQYGGIPQSMGGPTIMGGVRDNPGINHKFDQLDGKDGGYHSNKIMNRSEEDPYAVDHSTFHPNRPGQVRPQHVSPMTGHTYTYNTHTGVDDVVVTTSGGTNKHYYDSVTRDRVDAHRVGLAMSNGLSTGMGRSNR